MTKRLFLYAFCLLAVVTDATAQVQQGYIRSINRPNRQPRPIAGVTVSIGGVPNSVVTDAKGQFSFNYSGQSYRIMRIQKQGYQLIDKGVIGRQNPFSSSVRQEIVMVSQADLAADKKRIEDKAYERAQADYQRRLDAIQQQLAAQQLTQQQAAQAEAELGDNYQRYIHMIGDMAERYATTDYEGITDLNRRILQCIENTELELADSLINTKGSNEQRRQEVEHKRQLMQATQALAQQSQQDYEFSLKDLADDWYNKHTIFLAQYQNDSAAYYIEQRAALDTTNVEWQNQAGEFNKDMVANYPKALRYYQRMLRQSQLQYGEQSRWTATAYHNIGLVYNGQNDWRQAREFLNKALDIRKTVLGEQHPDVAQSYNAIGVYRMNIGDLWKAYDIYKAVFSEQHPEVARCYNNIGYIYYAREDYKDDEKALEYYKKALEIWETVHGKRHPDVAGCYNNIGMVYYDQGRYETASFYLLYALSVNLQVLGDNHPSTANVYNNYGMNECMAGHYDTALECLQKALEINRTILGERHRDTKNIEKNIESVKRKMESPR